MSFNTLKTTLLLSLLTGLLMLIGYWLAGSSGMVIGLALAIGMNFGSYWFSDRIALAMAGAREVTSRDRDGARNRGGNGADENVAGWWRDRRSRR